MHDSALEPLMKLARHLILTFIPFISLALCCSGQSGVAAPQTVSLDGNWQFRQISDSVWRPAQVPGDVHLDLMRNKLIPDPSYRENETKLQWIEKANWEYRTNLNVTPAMMKHSHLDLVFLGLDTTAQVFINDHPVLNADNMFRRWRIEAKPDLHVGDNMIRVEFQSDEKEGEKLAAADPTHESTRIPDKAYIRKAAYEYGWDWGPQLVTVGIWQPVYLEIWDEARIDRVAIEQQDINPNVAHLLAHVEIVSDGKFSGEVTLSCKGSGAPHLLRQKVELHAGENAISIPVEITKPALWFPNGYGSQPLYDFEADLMDGGQTVDRKSARTGLRKIELRQNPDQWGRSFEFVVNGIPIFIKGFDVIPFDSFPTRVTEERYRRILDSARQSHVNMLRLWGGGYYESDTFYNLCDEMGIMVWQDFMFASSWYLGSVEWKDNVRAEAEYQVNRLRNHPSIALWCGNNEVESVLNAFLGGLPANAQLQVWKNYLTTFSGILPRVVAQYSPEIPYWPSSPSSNYETTTDTFQVGDAHDWSIWHGREPFANYRKHFFRFNSEYGFQSFPEMKTIESFTTPEDRTSIFTPVMLSHQKNNEGNSIIHEYLLRDYSEPKDFASFLYVSQVLQAEGVKVGAEHMRRNRPRIMGSLIWQLNDCWPVASWSSIDYFGRWKALQYYARRFYSPILVSPDVADGKANVFVVSDKTLPVEGVLRARFLTMDGKVVLQESKAISLPPLSSASYLTFPFDSIAKEEQDLSKLVLAVDFSTGGEELSRNLIYLEPTKLVHLLPAKIETSIVPDGKSFSLVLSSKVVARDVYVTFGDLDVTVSDNYFDLLPGESYRIKLDTSANAAQLSAQLKVISLVDSFTRQNSDKEAATK
jgi:beta-mannosidase